MRYIGHEVLAHLVAPLRGGGDGARGQGAVLAAGERGKNAPMRETAECGLRMVSDACSRQRWLPPLLCAALIACCEAPAHAGSANPPLASATFINSARPDNNNGGTASLYVGNDINGGAMRGLIRFDLTASLNERASINSIAVTMTTAALAGGSPPVAATAWLQRLTESWGQGTGAGVDPITGDFTEGATCSPGGATWKQPFCSGAAWSTIGGSVAATTSGSASVPAVSGSVVQWNSTPGLVSDVQGWVDVPSSNYGWRLHSSTEAIFFAEQRFAKDAALSVSYGCKNGFEEIAGSCTTCTTAAESACVTLQSDNTCNDSGPPSTTYSCTCNNPAYVAGPGGTSCVNKNECVPNHCADEGDAAAICIDHAAPATGYSCSCSVGFITSGGTCALDDRIFANGFEGG